MLKKAELTCGPGAPLDGGGGGPTPRLCVRPCLQCRIGCRVVRLPYIGSGVFECSVSLFNVSIPEFIPVEGVHAATQSAQSLKRNLGCTS